MASHHHDYYLHNSLYSDFLETQDVSDFRRYIDTIQAYVSTEKTFLDVGCGTGIVVDYLAQEGYKASGVEISDSSLIIAQKKCGTYLKYDGSTLPFLDNDFDMVGSFNVLEHVENVSRFLTESIRVTKPGGFIVVCTPNFLSLTNSYHYRTSGIYRKLTNLVFLLMKSIINFFLKQPVFDTFPPVERSDFHPDDDAINLTNPVDLVWWAKRNNLDVVTWYGTTVYSVGLGANVKEFMCTHWPFKYIMGSILIVYRKK